MFIIVFDIALFISLKHSVTLRDNLLCLLSVINLALFLLGNRLK